MRDVEYMQYLIFQRRFEEFKKDIREKHLVEKFHLVSQTAVAVRDNEKLTDSNVALEGRVNDLKLDIERLREELEAAQNATGLSESKANDFQLDNKRLREDLEAAQNATGLSESKANDLQLDNKCLREELEAAQNTTGLSESKANDLQLDNKRLREEVEAAHVARQLAEKKLIDKLRETRDQGSTIKELSTQCGSVMGHQNHSQKIKYMVKLKTENVELKLKVQCT